MRHALALSTASAALFAGAALPAAAQLSPGSGPASAETVLLEPVALDPTAERVEALERPEGFAVEVFAEGLGEPRIIAVSEAGNVYVTRRDEEDLVLLGDGDGDGDGEATEPRTVLELEGIHGVHIAGSRLYVATVQEIHAADLADDGAVGELELLASDLPAGGQHPNRTLAIGPDGLLYYSVGSTCNACDEPDDRHATMLRMPATGGEPEIHAEGLRNTIGFGWHPETGALWGMDHGSDGRGSEQPPEELNRIEAGRHYGWPWCWGEREPDAFIPGLPEGHDSKEAFCATTEAPTLTYDPHAAPLQAAFYDAEGFPEEYRGDLFQTISIQNCDAFAANLDQSLSLQIVQYLSSRLSIGADAFSQILMGQAANRIIALFA